MVCPRPWANGALVMPLFSCKDCGMRIERSMATYWKHKGQLLCSTCQDLRELSRQEQSLPKRDGQPSKL